MKRVSAIFARRNLGRARAFLPAASASQQPYFQRWEVMVNVALAVMQVIALVFLSFAFHSQEKALHAQQQALTDQVFARLDDKDAENVKIFFEHPHLRPYFFEGVPPPTDMDNASVTLRRQVAALADLHLMFIEMFDNDYVRRLPEMEYGAKYDQVWRAYFLELFKQSPALCARYVEVQSKYSPSMCERYARFTCKCKRSSQN